MNVFSETLLEFGDEDWAEGVKVEALSALTTHPLIFTLPCPVKDKFSYSQGRSSMDFTPSIPDSTRVDLSGWAVLKHKVATPIIMSINNVRTINDINEKMLIVQRLYGF
jgi:hypothetical protein